MSSTPGHPSPPAFPGLPLPSPSAGGRVAPGDRRGIWPAHPDFLTDTTRCPSCFTALTASSFAPAASGSAGPVCLSCGLDLSGPEAADVFDAGTGIVEAESRRQRLLTQMRTSQAARDAARAAAYRAAAEHSATQNAQAPSPAFSAPPTQTGQPAPLSAWYPPQSAPPLPPAGQPFVQEPAGPRRSGVQILMLTVGVILVSIMAIFFVLLAYLIASLEVRSVLTGVASLAVFGVAWLLHRRRLSGTAQGIAVLAVVLLLLDLWIIRANDLFGSGGLDGWLYSGLATGVLAGLLALVFRVLPLRSLSLAAVLLAPFAVFAVTLGILSNAEATTSSWAALTAVGAATLAWPLIRFGALERGVVRGIGFLAAELAIFPASFAFPGPDAGPVLSLLVLAFVWFGHLLVSPTPAADALPASADALDQPGTAAPRTSLMQVLSALGLGLTVATIGPAVWFRLPELSMSLWAPAAITLAGAVVLALVARLLISRRSLLRISAVVPLAIGAFAALPAAVVTLSQFAAVLTARPFSLAVIDDIPGVLPEYRWTVALALVLVTVLMASVLALVRHVRTAGWVPAAFGALGLVAACFALATPALSGLGLLVVAITGVLATASPRLAGAYRVISAVGAALATLGLFVVGLTSTVSFPFSVLATGALLVTFREVVRRVLRYSTARWLTPVVLVALVTVLLVSLRLIPAWVQAVTGVTASPTGPALLLSLCALATLAAVPLTTAFLTRSESATVAAVTVIPLGFGLVELSTRIPVDAVPFLVACGITAAIGTLWQLVRGVANWPERYVAALATPPLVVLFVSVLSDQFDPSATLLLASAAVVILAGAALVVFRPAARSDVVAATPKQIARVGWDATLALSAVPLVLATVTGDDLGWVSLLLTAVAALIIASGAGGVFRGQSPRRHVAWAGLPLAIGALWLALARNDVTGLEFYTLPVAGLLLALLALIVVRRTLPADGSARTTLFGAAVAVALLPSAAAADAFEPLRGALVIGVASALLLGGPFLVRSFRGIRVAAVVWLGGATAAVLAVLVLAFRGDPDGWQNESVAAALLLGGLLWLHRTQAPRAFGTAAIALSPVLLAVSVSIAMVTADVQLWRFLPVLVVICALSAVATLPRLRVPLVRWAALASAVVVAAVGITTGVADPFEIATVPIAVALLVGGALRMAADPAARSWPALGAGVLLLLVPSLLADLGSTDLWRVLALGVVALAVFGVGLALKLSAPTLIGAVVLVIHGLAQLWPWISGLYGAVPWWLWAGIGGVVLIFFAATYEKRIRDLRSVARSISSLR